MDLKQLKESLSEINELKGLLGVSGIKPESVVDGKNLYDRYIGKYVICRTRNEGINAGKVLELDETGVILEDARRLYYHRPSNKKLSWYEGVALEGLSSDSKIGAPVEKIISEDYSLTVCTDAGESSIRGAVTNEQS